MPARDRCCSPHRRRAQRCRRPRPVACAIAGADRPVRPRWRSGVQFAYAAAASGTFVQRLGQLRTVDLTPSALRSLRAAGRSTSCAGPPPALPTTGWPHGNAASLFNSWPGAMLAQRPRTVAHEVAAPQADCIFTHTECLGDAGSSQAGQGQQHGTSAVRLAAITRAASAVRRHVGRRSLKPVIGFVIVGTANRCRQGINPSTVGQAARSA